MKKSNIILLILTVLLFFGITAISFATTISQKDIELKNKIGQMLIIGFRDTEITKNSYISNTMKDLNIGGVILFDRDNPSKGQLARNISSPQQTQQLITDLKKYSPSPIFVSVDAEGGYVNRLKNKYGFFDILSAEKMGQGNLEQTKQQAELLAQELLIMGFNVNFAPDVDVNINPNNPVIGYLERSFSDDPQKVSLYADAFIKEMQKYNIITAIKHFPGHGSSTSDSHLGLVDVTKTYTPKELIPYLSLINNGYSDMIMTAHIVNTAIDPNYPATLSSVFINTLLKNILGFKGVVISDDMQMGAIINNYGFEESLTLAINAGCDMLIISNNIDTYDEEAPYKAVDAIFTAVKSNKISEQRINDAYDKIIQLKKNRNIQ
ncbi:MAG: glycoside hydrolase family 3 protein [Candidatus Paceibacterota bacterium]|jgi:beta-N-acetylhexosaminidase